jgi:hypothetical protein
MPEATVPGAEAPEPIERYLDLVKRVLLREDFDPVPGPLDPAIVAPWKRPFVRVLQRGFARRGIQLTVPSRAVHVVGETMIGRARLDNLQHCVEDVLRDGVPGDLVETGVWRGGAGILMRAVLAAHEVPDRCVWLAHSFAGFPDVEQRSNDLDRSSDFTSGLGDEIFRVTVDDVRRNFSRFALLDDQVRFLEGWFANTLPSAPIERIAVLRLDGDLYASTWDALTALYERVSAGGFVIVDDYGTYEACRAAVDTFRQERAITDEVTPIDGDGVFWRRSR